MKQALLAMAIVAQAAFAQLSAVSDATAQNVSHDKISCVKAACRIDLSSRSADVVHVASGNFAVDLYGAADTRPGTWGFADVAIWTITFDPPAGYEALIVGLDGDLVSFPANPTNQALAPNGFAGVLLGFQTLASGGSDFCDFCADDTMLYIQDAVRLEPRRAPFDRRYAPSVEWLPGNQLLVKVASFLNTTGLPVHVEPTYTITFVLKKLDKE